MSNDVVSARKLSDYEIEILNGIGTSGRTVTFTKDHWDGSGTFEAQDWEAQAYVVYTDDLDGVSFGPVRWCSPKSWHSDKGAEDYWSVSPFPGAWAAVPLGRILRVRKTMD